MSAVTQADQDDLHLIIESYREANLQKSAKLEKLLAAVVKIHAAKGRYHTQIAAAELYELCGLPAERPKK
jgi:hypothetical protein